MLYIYDDDDLKTINYMSEQNYIPNFWIFNYQSLYKLNQNKSKSLILTFPQPHIPDF